MWPGAVYRAAGVSASGAALVWGSLDRRPRGAASSGRHWSGPGGSVDWRLPSWSTRAAVEALFLVAVEFASPELFLACVAGRHERVCSGARATASGCCDHSNGEPQTRDELQNARYASRFGPYSCSVI